jgi:hypothetical protein
MEQLYLPLPSGNRKPQAPHLAKSIWCEIKAGFTVKFGASQHTFSIASALAKLRVSLRS